MVRCWRKGGATAHAHSADCDIRLAGFAARCALYGRIASLCGGGVAESMRNARGMMRETKP